MYTDEQINEMRLKLVSFEAKNETLKDEIQLKTYEVEALRQDRERLIARLQEATDLLQSIANDYEVIKFEVL